MDATFSLIDAENLKFPGHNAATEQCVAHVREKTFIRVTKWASGVRPGKDEKGLISGHAYSILAAIEVC